MVAQCKARRGHRSPALRLIAFIETAVAPCTVGKTSGAIHRFGEHDRITAGAFAPQGLVQLVIPLAIERTPVGTQTLLREARNRVRQFQCSGQLLTAGNTAAGQAHL